MVGFSFPVRARAARADGSVLRLPQSAHVDLERTVRRPVRRHATGPGRILERHAVTHADRTFQDRGLEADRANVGVGLASGGGVRLPIGRLGAAGAIGEDRGPIGGVMFRNP
jgi:hypothetical protein